MNAPDSPSGRGSSEAAAAPGESIRGAGLMKVLVVASVFEGLLVSLVLVFGDPMLTGAGFADNGIRVAALAASTALTCAFLWLLARSYTDTTWWARVVGSAGRAASQVAPPQPLAAVFFLSLLACVIAAFGTSLRLNPGIDQLSEGFLRRGGPLVLWIALMALQAASVSAALSNRPTGYLPRVLLLGGAAFAFVLLYWYGAEGQLLSSNDNMGRTDQSAYMEFARILRDSGYSYPGDFNRMPLYPFLLTAVLQPNMANGPFFLAAKYLNLFLSMLLLGGLAVVFVRRSSPLPAATLILIVAFTVFIYKAGWVQAELLFYFLNTCLFLLLWRLLQAPSYGVAVAAGLVAGLAHLTKASVLPALILFAIVGMWKAGVVFLSRRRESPRGFWNRAGVLELLVVVLTVAVFLAVISPYLRTAARITGHPFYNVNSTFYIWYDSWAEAEAGTKAHGDRTGWPNMPPEEIPSLQKYLDEHEPGQVVERVIFGGRKVTNRVLHSYPYPKYLVVYGVTLAVAVALHRRRAWAGVSANAFLILFFISYFFGYALLYFWYAPIAADDRLILAQFIPLLLVLEAGGRWLLKEDRVRLRGGSIGALTLVNLLVLGMVCVDAFWAVTRGVYLLRGVG